LDGYIARHIGAIDTMIRTIKENPEINVAIKDTRNITSYEEAKAAHFIDNPTEMLAILENLRYNKDTLKKDIEKNL